MTKTKIIILKKSLIVAIALVLGFLMPYLSRIPYALTYGVDWIFKYMRNDGDFARWNGFHLFSLIPICLFGLVFIFGNIKWGFYASVLGHFVSTAFIYHNFAEPAYRDDFLGCIVFPPMFAIASFLCGLVGLIAELIITGRKGKQR